MIHVPVEHRRNWILTHTGRQVHLFEPASWEIDIADIAQGLANTCRFGGQAPEFYSVAQHSVYVAEQVARWIAANRDPVGAPVGRAEVADAHRNLVLWALLHDAAEAYIGDIVRPMKRALGLQAVEGPIQAAISRRFDLYPTMPVPDAVKQADEVVLATEALWLLGCAARGRTGWWRRRRTRRCWAR